MTSAPSIRILVFDFGQVIGHFDHSRTTRKLLPFSPLAAEELHSRLFGGELEEAYELGRISTAEFLQEASRQCRLQCSQEFLAEAWADIFWPNEEMCRLVARLRGSYPLLLASNTNELHARHFCRLFSGTLSHFKNLVFSHEVGMRKPMQGFFDHCLQLADCGPENCLFIDDLPANVAGARACGWHGIVYTTPTNLKKSLCEYHLADVV